MQRQSEMLVREWIRVHMNPAKNVDHMHTSTSLRMMAERDMRCKITDERFKSLMVEEGFLPVDRMADEWEFRISPAATYVGSRKTAGKWLSGVSQSNYRSYRKARK